MICQGQQQGPHYQGRQKLNTEPQTHSSSLIDSSSKYLCLSLTIFNKATYGFFTLDNSLSVSVGVRLKRESCLLILLNFYLFISMYHVHCMCTSYREEFWNRDRTMSSLLCLRHILLNYLRSLALLFKGQFAEVKIPVDFLLWAIGEFQGLHQVTLNERKSYFKRIFMSNMNIKIKKNVRKSIVVPVLFVLSVFRCL